MKSDTLLIAECAEYQPPELLKEVARRLDREWERNAGPVREDVKKALTRLLHQYHKWAFGRLNDYDATRHDFLSMFPEGDE